MRIETRSVSRTRNSCHVQIICCNVTQCRHVIYRRFGGKRCFQLRDRRMTRILILVVHKYAELSSKTASICYQNIRRHISKDSNLYSHGCETLKSSWLYFYSCFFKSSLFFFRIRFLFLPFCLRLLCSFSVPYIYVFNMDGGCTVAEVGLLKRRPARSFPVESVCYSWWTKWHCDWFLSSCFGFSC